MYKFSSEELETLIDNKVFTLFEACLIDVYANNGNIFLKANCGTGERVLDNYMDARRQYVSFDDMERCFLKDFNSLIVGAFFSLLSVTDLDEALLNNRLSEMGARDKQTLVDDIIWDLQNKDLFEVIDSLRDLTPNDTYILNYDCYESVSFNAIIEKIKDDFCIDTCRELLDSVWLSSVWERLYNCFEF